MVTLLTSSGKPILLDSEDYGILVNNFNPINSTEFQKTGGLRLSVSSYGYVVLKVGRKQSHLVRLILGILDQPSLIVKYLNNNKLDLRRENLRVSTRREHCREEVLTQVTDSFRESSFAFSGYTVPGQSRKFKVFIRSLGIPGQ